MQRPSRRGQTAGHDIIVPFAFVVDALAFVSLQGRPSRWSSVVGFGRTQNPNVPLGSGGSWAGTSPSGQVKARTGGAASPGQNLSC